jgi:shikimate kinase
MNLYLIGYRGSGKTSVGRLLADQLQWQHFDCDATIVELAGKSIARIFADHGEEAFRQWESKVVAVAASDQQMVVSLGGGALIEMENRDRINSSGKCVWLRIKPATAWERIQQDNSTAENRPALTGLSGLEEVQTLIARRQPLYEECADFTVDVDQLSLNEVADRIISWWRSTDQTN